MADSRSHIKPQFLPKEVKQNHSNFTHILCKSLVFIVFVIVIPLFPSQSPEIFNHTLLNKFWELFHLLFIGLAVCYGLFSRRNSDLESETTTHSNSVDDDSQSSFVSRIFHVSPIFEDGSEIQFGSDEKNACFNWDSQIYNKEESRSRSNVDNDGHIKIGGFPNSENRSEISAGLHENHVVQAWSSQYFHGESVVVVSQPNYASEQWGKPPNVGGFQPLGLPVRSLNSRVGNADGSHLFSNGSVSESSLMDSSNCSPKSMEEEKFGDQGPMNSDKKLNENVFLPTQNPLLSRSGRSELRERVVPLSDGSLLRNSDSSGRPELRERVVPLSDSSHFRNSDSSGRPELRGRVVPLSNSSRFQNSDSSHLFSDGSVSDSSLMGSSNCSPKSMGEVEEKFGDQGAVNLDEKLNVNGLLPSQSPWLSRAGRSDLREKAVPLSNRSHFRPLSADATQFESFKSQFFRSSACFSSQTSSESTSPNLLSPSQSSCSDSPKSVTEEPVKMKEREATFSPLATESPKREALLNAFHLRRYSSSGSLFKKDTQKRAKDDPKYSSRKRRQDGQQGSLKPDKKSTNSDRTPSRGKSVRTIRSGAYTPEAKKAGETSKLLMDDNIGKGCDVAKAVDATRNKNVDSNYKVPNPTFAEYHMREKKEALKNATVESEHESEPQMDNSRVRLHNNAPSPSVSDSGHGPDEVDKKASEFIAKFREQIRLQKVASMERSKVIRMSSKYLR